MYSSTLSLTSALDEGGWKISSASCFFLFSRTLLVLCPASCLLFLLTPQTSMPPAGFEPATPASARP